MKNISLYIPNVTTPEPGYDAINIENEMALQSIPNGSCDEIIITSTLDCLEYKQRYSVLELAVYKLAYNGTVVVNGADILLIARDLLSQVVNIADCNNHIYTNKRSMASVEETVTHLQTLGLKILQKRLHNSKYSIVAQRIAPE